MVHQKDFKGLVLGGEIDLSFGVYEVPVVVSLECGRELRERCGWYFVEVYCFGLVNGFGFELFDPARCRFVGIDKYMLGSFGGFVEAFSAWATDFDPEVASPGKVIYKKRRFIGLGQARFGHREAFLEIERIGNDART